MAGFEELRRNLLVGLGGNKFLSLVTGLAERGRMRHRSQWLDPFDRGKRSAADDMFCIV